MSDTNNNKILKPLSYLAKPFYDYYKYLSFNKIFSVKGISNDEVHVFGKPQGKNILYVIKLESRNNFFETFGFKKIKSALRHSIDAQFTYYFIKNSNFQVGYVSTFSREVAQTISDKINLPILKANDTIQFLLDIYSVTEYYANSEDLTIDATISAKRLQQDSIIDSMQYNLSTVLEEGAYLIDEKYKLFQAVKFSNKQDFNYTKTFTKKFDGMVQIAVDLSDRGSNFIIDKSMRYATIMDRKKLPDYKRLSDESKLGKVDAVVCNAIILSDSEREAHNLASALGIEIVEKKLNKIEIISKSLMLTRELDYDALLPVEYVDKIIGVRNKRTISREQLLSLNSDKSWVDIKIDFNGRDLFDAPTNFCFRANENPHAVLIADAGTGKSVAIQKILKTILRYSIKENRIKRFKEVKTRYFEIGGSSSKLLNAIKSLYPEDVGILTGDMDSMRFSIIDLKIDGEENGATMANTAFPTFSSNTLSMSNMLMNTILEESGENIITASEEAVLNMALRDIYKNKKYTFKTLGEIERLGREAYNDILIEASKRGYKTTTRVNEIDDIKDIGKLQKPLIDDVMAYVNKKTNVSEITDIDKRIHDSLYLKLKAIRETQTGIFGALSSIDFNNKQFYSFEFNKLKENPSLLKIIFTFLFSMVYSKDVSYAIKMKEEGGVMPQIIYIFEESRNFIYGNKSITRMLEKTVFEGRKFQIHAFFVAQQVSHIPLNIIEGCSTFMFLMPEGIEQRSSLTSDIKKLYPNLKTIDFLLDNIEYRSLGIISSTGVGSCRLELTQDELEMFAN